MRRTLHLKRETLAELSVDELVAVNGAEALPTGEGRCPTIPVDECVEKVRTVTGQLVQNTVGCIPKTLLCR